MNMKEEDKEDGHNTVVDKVTGNPWDETSLKNDITPLLPLFSSSSSASSSSFPPQPLYESAVSVPPSLPINARATIWTNSLRQSKAKNDDAAKQGGIDEPDWVSGEVLVQSGINTSQDADRSLRKSSMTDKTLAPKQKQNDHQQQHEQHVVHKI
jgi:hypothetical protein